jgi:hypothetical protein
MVVIHFPCGGFQGLIATPGKNHLESNTSKSYGNVLSDPAASAGNDCNL